MTEAETRKKLIDPKLAAAGWKKEDIHEEVVLTSATTWNKQENLRADYVLTYNGVDVAVVEAKKTCKSEKDGIAQAILYADKLGVEYAIATNGHKIYMINMHTKKQDEIKYFPSPDELTHGFKFAVKWLQIFRNTPFRQKEKTLRAYQVGAINKTLVAIAEGKNGSGQANLYHLPRKILPFSLIKFSLISVNLFSVFLF